MTVTERKPQSTFVTVVAWIFIVLSGFSTLVTAFQSVFVMLMFRAALGSSAEKDVAMNGQPLFVRFMLLHPYVWFLACFVVSATTLVASIGVLRRRNWARLTLVGLLTAGIAWTLFSFPTAYWFLSKQPLSRDTQFRTMVYVMMAFTSALGFAIAALFAWLVK